MEAHIHPTATTFFEGAFASPSSYIVEAHVLATLLFHCGGTSTNHCHMIYTCGGATANHCDYIVVAYALALHCKYFIVEAHMPTTAI